jgi:hypothetical protein
MTKEQIAATAARIRAGELVPTIELACCGAKLQSGESCAHYRVQIKPRSSPIGWFIWTLPDDGTISALDRFNAMNRYLYSGPSRHTWEPPHSSTI